jgi:hypothetical protein
MEYLRRVFEALMPPKETRAQEHADVEAFGCGDGERIVIVTEAADVRVCVSPLMRRTDIHNAIDV